MRYMIVPVATALLAAPALAMEFTLSNPQVSTASAVIPFSAKDSFGQPQTPLGESFPGERREQNVEFQIQGGASNGGPMPGLTITATRSPFPTPGTTFPR